MILIKWLRVATALLCLATLQVQPALAGKYGSFRSAPTRTPSISAPSPAPRVTASPSPAQTSNGGYGSFRTDRTPSISTPPRPALVGSDRAISRENSGSALRDMRRQDTIARETVTRTPSATVNSTNEGGSFGRPTWTRPTVAERTPSIAPAPQWQRQADWTIPSYAQPRQSYGDWNPFLMWYLISSLSRPGSSDFFHNHQNDPGYRQWRQEADNQARTNADLKAKLDELDKKLAEKKDEPINANYVPPNIDPKVAHATQPVATGGGHWLLTLFVILLLGALATLAWITWNERRKRRAQDRTGLEPMSNTSILTDIVKTKIQGTVHAAPERFKIGQVMTIERTPFIMASGSKIVRPETRDGTTSIARIGKLSGTGGLVRLYLDDVNFLQVSEAADGTIADCRYFSRIDEVYPGSAEDWRLWLDPQSGWSDLDQGILSDPKFRTEDDALYDRVWSPGDGRVPPREMRETVTDLDGTREIAITAQLYAKPMPDAADKREYLLAEVREEGSNASVIIYAGIDLPASSLGL